MVQRLLIRTIAVIELLIGACTLASIAAAITLSTLSKPPNVLLMVIITSIISVLLGAGLFRQMKEAAILLVFFSGYVILTKILIVTGLIHFNGELITGAVRDMKNGISVVYHLGVIIVLTRPSVRKMLK